MKLSTAVLAVIATLAPCLVSATEITVIVGASKDGTVGLRFDPQEITAQQGDIVKFEFRGGNHTVTQSSFANPCAWQLNTVTNQTGFNSGFLPYVNTSGQVSVFSLEINNPNTPIWFFCGRPPHCKMGMYGAINAPTTGNKTFAEFAANVQTTNEPGLKLPFRSLLPVPAPAPALALVYPLPLASPTPPSRLMLLLPLAAVLPCNQLVLPGLSPRAPQSSSA
jgi:plastocyanin